MRQVFSRLTAMGVVAAMALACSGPQEEKDVVPGDVTVEVVAADATSCPSGLVPWPGGGCAPRIDDCPNPWELPLIGGGCLPIGPRACPKTWNPEAEVDCEVGTLMEYDGNACPEGFVLTEDEVACIPFFEENCGEMEIPVLGGGCKKVGPDWYDPEAPYGGLDVPYFDECGPGLLALEGGGCVQVGPRACPKLWDPESVVDCEVGDVLPCPDGWSESEDGMYCDPKYGECGPGERSLVGGGCERVVPLAKDCPPGPFPEVPEGAKDVVYVSAASTCTEGCGSEGAPFKTITAALEAVPDGGYVLVGAGEYEEGVLIQKPVRLMGICAPLVRVSGSVPLLGANVQDMESAGILVSGGNSVGLSRLGVTPANAGIVLLDASGAQLESIEITGGEGPGLYLGGGSAASAGGLWVSDTHYGVLVSKGASLELHEALVDSVFLLGIRAMGTQAQISLSGTTIRATRPDAAGQYGYGIGMSGGSSGTVEGCLLDGNTGEGVLLSDDKTKLAISTSVIRGTAADKDGSYGHAIEAMYGAEVTVSGSLLDANAARGVVVWDSGTQVTLAQTTLSGTVGSKGGNGIGLKVQHGGALNAVGCLLEGNSGVGAHATGQQSSLQLVGTAIRKTQPQLNGQYGNALQVDNGAMVGVVLSLFEANTSAGMVLWHSGTKVMLDNTVVQDTVPDSIGMVGGVGVQVRKGASLEMSESLVVGNSAVGVQAGEVGSRAELTRSEVRGTKTTAGGMVGYGMQLTDGAYVSASSCLIRGNAAIGIRTGGPAQSELSLVGTAVRGGAADVGGDTGAGPGVLAQDSTVAVVGSLVDDNTEAGVVAWVAVDLILDSTVVRNTVAGAELGEGLPKGGFGLENIGASAIVQESLFEGNSTAGVWVGLDGASVDLLSTVVRDTEPDDNGEGLGMMVCAGGFVSAESSLFAGNSAVGVAVYGQGTEAVLSGTVVRDSKANNLEFSGIGVEATDQASLTASGCLFGGSAYMEVIAVGAGTQVHLGSTKLHDTAGASQEIAIRAVQATEGASFDIRDSLLEGFEMGGIGAYRQGTRVNVAASVVRDSMLPPGLANATGVALEALGGAAVAISGCLFDARTTAGVAAGEAGTAVVLRGTMIRGTKAEEEGRYGMGVALTEGAAMTLFKTLLDKNATAGALLLDPGSIMLFDTSAVTGTLIGGATVDGPGKGVFGDGIVAAAGGELEVASVLVARNARNGIFFSHASGTVANSTIVGNDFYGLAMEECADQVEWEGKGNYVVGNASALPPDKAVQVTTSTGGMAVPPAPEMIEIQTE